MLKKRAFTQYVKVYFSIIAIVLGTIATFNIGVDPYGIWHSPTLYGWNWAKPLKNNHVRLFKAADIKRIKPITVLIGSSRVEYGLSPKHKAFRDRQPAYNLGLPRANMYEEMRYFQHALQNQPQLKQAVIGLDFHAFNKFIDNRDDFSESRLGGKASGIGDSFLTTLSIDAINASKKTIKLNRLEKDFEDPNYQYFELDGSRLPMERQGVVIANSSHRLDMFKATLAQHLQSPDFLIKYQLSPERLRNFQTIIDTCTRKKIDLKIFISPTHAADLEAIHNAGLWQEFEEWKRQISALAPIWDFSGYNSITTEPVSNDMKNYWDSHHYRKNVGDLVLSRMFDDCKETTASDFGEIITAKNIESHLARIRGDRSNWLKSNPKLVELVRSLAP